MDAEHRLVRETAFVGGQQLKPRFELLGPPLAPGNEDAVSDGQLHLHVAYTGAG